MLITDTCNYIVYWEVGLAWFLVDCIFCVNDNEDSRVTPGFLPRVTRSKLWGQDTSQRRWHLNGDWKDKLQLPKWRQLGKCSRNWNTYQASGQLECHVSLTGSGVLYPVQRNRDVQDLREDFTFLEIFKTNGFYHSLTLFLLVLPSRRLISLDSMTFFSSSWF